MKYYVFLIVAMLLLLGACEVKSPVMPKWDIDLAVPLINENYYVSDLVNDDGSIICGEDSIMYINIEGNVNTHEFGNIHFAPPASAAFFDNPVYHVPNIPDTSMDFEDPEIQFTYAKVGVGIIQTKFTALVAGSSVTIVFANLFNADNTNYVIIAEDTGDWVTWDLSGAHFGVIDAPLPFDPIAEISFSVTSNSSAAMGTHTGDLSLKADALMEFDEVQGKMTDLSMPLMDDLASIDIDYPEGMNEAVTLETATIKMLLENQIGFKSEFVGEFYAYNDKTPPDFASVEIKDNNGQNFIIFPGQNSLDVSGSLSELLSIMPTHIEIRNGVFNVLSRTEAGSVRAGDSISLNYTLNAPFTFTLYDNPIVVKNEVDIPVSSENAERINKNALGAKLELYITNKLPVGATATAFFSSSPNIDVNDPATYNFSKPAVIYSSETYAGEQPLVELSLNENEIKLFGNPHVYLRWMFVFHPSDGAVTIYGRTSDYIKIKGRLTAKISVEDL
ncbi:MAG: hypothetical protein CVU50_09960 [Candidatus Cloacimonetes bacterium HGW-Cloacimonetes-3]|jgi:hypothetical protein|nr:MAG: hypothetical protein CVU50_09960 [Candidatus Cloacimonetes bacterium HGW-Cloacimonetes-3]